MTRCYVSEQIAEHANQDNRAPCFNCAYLIDEDEVSTEIEHPRCGTQFICGECEEDFEHMVVN